MHFENINDRACDNTCLDLIRTHDTEATNIDGIIRLDRDSRMLKVNFIFSLDLRCGATVSSDVHVQGSRYRV